MDFIPQASSSFFLTFFFSSAVLAYAGWCLSTGHFKGITIEFLDAPLDNLRHPGSPCGKVYSLRASVSHTDASSEHPHY